VSHWVFRNISLYQTAIFMDFTALSAFCGFLYNSSLNSIYLIYLGYRIRFALVSFGWPYFAQSRKGAKFLFLSLYIGSSYENYLTSPDSSGNPFVPGFGTKDCSG
jgi:hypothetical protein